MIKIFSSIKFFFFLFFFFSFHSLALDYPKPEPKPLPPKKEFQDVFQQIRKQNWVMAITLADDYNNKNLSSYVRWLDITRPGSNHNFNYLVKFYNNHQNWPEKEKIIKKIESSITKEQSSTEIRKWFKKNPPLTSKGSIDFLEAKIKVGEKIDLQREVKNIWINKNLTFKQQKYFISKYSKYWDNLDNWNRFKRLKYEGKNVSARRTLNRIYGDLRKLGEAQFALSRRSPNVSSLINKVPQNLINDPGLIYERMRWRRKAKLETAAELLLNPPDKIENKRNWWINARIVVRRLINKKKFNKAYSILNNHKLSLDNESGIEAEWLAGWVSLHHLNKPENSIIHFSEVYNNSKNKNIKSKAAYWNSLAYKKIKNNIEEKKWLKISSSNKFTFYGQNASLKLGNLNLKKKKIKSIRPEGSENLLAVIDIIIDAGLAEEKTLTFFKRLMDINKKTEHREYILQKALNLKNKYIITTLARKLQNPSIYFSYPLISNYIPQKFKNSPYTVALIHAISHQESNFRVKAYSSAGARGVMQLMPFTAKKVARDLRIKYYKKELTRNPQYNITLGTTYINEMLKKFKNSLPLSLAAYNAGPSRVKIWLNRYGDPRDDEISYINWIESIPLEETRYYVKKVLSNLRIYQKKLDLELYEYRKELANNLQ